MNALVIIDKKKASVIYTDINNIDWESKSIINNIDIEEKELLLEDTIDVYDILLRLHIKVKVKNLSTDRHHILINKKLFVPLHIL